MELTIGSLNIFIGPSGSTRLSDPTKPDPSASESEMKAMMESSEGSSSEVTRRSAQEKNKSQKAMKFRKNLTQKRKRLKRTIIQGTSPLEVVASPKEYISYAS
jgi:dsDNA-specific endonuclease/ATPase MutS2